jgi:hypothetical protein
MTNSAHRHGTVGTRGPGACSFERLARAVLRRRPRCPAPDQVDACRSVPDHSSQGWNGKHDGFHAVVEVIQACHRSCFVTDLDRVRAEYARPVRRRPLEDAP